MSDLGVGMKKWRATNKYARLSPRKARLVIDMIRGLPCAAALDRLRFCTKRPSVDIARTLKSAMANADMQEADMGRLFVSEARVDMGPTETRWRPKDRGRAHPILKKTSHIHIVLAEK